METTTGIREDQLGKGMIRSLVGHGGIVLIFILTSLVFPGEPIVIAPALRVDLVGLPDILKKDLQNVSKKIPKSSLQERLLEAARQAKEMKPLPKAEAPKPDEMVLNPKKMEKQEALAKEKKIDSALERIRALERIKDKSDDTPPDDDAVIIKGNQVSAGTSLSGDAKEKAQAGYYELVRQALVEFWSLPAWLGRQKLSAQIRICIDPAGQILSEKFIKTSGNDEFDAAIKSALQDAQPLPKPPKELLDSLADNGVVVGFPL